MTMIGWRSEVGLQFVVRMFKSSVTTLVFMECVTRVALHKLQKKEGQTVQTLA